ncbi:hypothetical protein ACCO45_011563 [Purpureocillium lilacinum]|uniref:Uncharacterized protein n=1 Tax=Purpureocillium lilacinum TaxID=33203 RepID=A0ACC4DBS7_PURLI
MTTAHRPTFDPARGKRPSAARPTTSASSPPTRNSTMTRTRTPSSSANSSACGVSERKRRSARKQSAPRRKKRPASGTSPTAIPSLNKQDFTMKRRWDDDVVFKNQARGTEDKGKKKEFVNDLLRSDFHRRFMNKYVR